MLSCIGSSAPKRRPALLLLIVVVSLLGSARLLTPTAAFADSDAVPGQYIIKFRSAKTQARAEMRSALRARLVKVLPLTNAQLIEAPYGDLDEAYAKKLLASGDVEYIEPNYILSINRAPSDPRFGELWGMNNTGSGGSADVDIDAPEAWGLSTGSSAVVVGIVDTGVDYTHQDLAPNMWINNREIAANGVDDDRNGIVDDVYGLNTVSGAARPGDPMDDNSHGSHTAGTIAAAGDNGLGVAGVNWNLKLMALKFLSASGSGSVSDAVSAISYAVAMKQRGVNVRALNNSWGGGQHSAALQNAISAANSAGIVFVAAAGNNSTDNDALASYPGSYDVPNVISVAAIDANGNLASFSNYGAHEVDLAAPGVDILSTVPGNDYAAYSGTSMATPHVTGVAALLASREPSLTPAQIRERLMNTVKPLAGLTGLVASPGTVSAYNALVNSRPTLPPADSLVSYSKRRAGAAYDGDLGARVLKQDDGYAEAALHFDFPYYQESFRRLAISANGRILPLAATTPLPTSQQQSDFSNKVMPGMNVYNDDLYPASSPDGGVWVKETTDGAVITWVAVHYGNRTTTNPDDEIRFQAKLFADGRIQFHYLDTHTANISFDYGTSATVSVAPPSGTAGSRLVVSDNAADPGNIGSGKALHFQIGQFPTVKSDFDGDGTSDIVVWRPPTGMFFILTSGSGFSYPEHRSMQLGLPGDIPLSGDFDGDGVADPTVWRPVDGTWYFRLSSNGFGTITSIQWGLSGDRPVPGDYDGDSKTDLAVYRISEGAFYVLKSASGFDRSRALSRSADALMIVNLGGPANDPVVGNFLGTGKDSFTVIWQLIRFWSVKDESNQLRFSLPWGEPGDTPLACDWDSDGIDERVMVRVNSGNTLDWYAVDRNGGAYTARFGSLADQPSCSRDYDGDGQSDISVFRPHTGEWFVRQSPGAGVRRVQFGLPGDIPL